MHEKYEKLKEILKSYGSVAVAFSGGTDSALLLFVAHEALGDGAIAVTVDSPVIPRREIEASKKFCTEIGVRQIIVKVDALSIEGFAENPKNRCYLCKKKLMGSIFSTAKENEISAVAEGSNVDDEGAYRPGMRAVEELGILSPLRDAGLSKSEIRGLSHELGLFTWDKPSSACLASRFAYGETITREGLSAVEDAENYLADMGFSQLRVRMRGREARIEVLPQDFEKIIASPTREKIYDHFRSLGFSQISLDLRGFRSGSWDEGDKL
ncbi:MAG: ATP-dependent sacrificial sulfur transferase LarE [Clostridiales bacterium]|nr:ATP-dependent sacrificial sulfur transferase LarE [Clostridiales bacterium]